MIDPIMFADLLGPEKHFIWSKENEVWRTFYRTTVSGHWSKDDIEEFAKCGCIYEIHFDHSLDAEAQLFCLMIMQRCTNFKAGKVSKFAINNMKVIIMLGHNNEYHSKIMRLARQSGFDFSRVRSREDHKSDVEKFTNSKMGQYLQSLKNAFAPMAGVNVERRPFE